MFRNKSLVAITSVFLCLAFLMPSIALAAGNATSVVGVDGVPSASYSRGTGVESEAEDIRQAYGVAIFPVTLQNTVIAGKNGIFRGRI